MSLDLSSGQIDATQRNTLAGAVYLLSGTLYSRVSGLADAPIRWSTHTFSGGPTGELWEAYIGQPDLVQEELAFKLGDEAPTHPIGVPIRNLPFRHSESLLTAITDEDYAWEGSEASLLVGYLQPGQSPADLASGDWTVLRKRGQLGSPQDIQQDGFRLPLLARESLRRQELHWGLATSGEYPNIDPKDDGRMVPFIFGAPDSWIPTVRVDAGVYGLTAQSVLSGTASGVFVSSDFDMTVLSGREVYVHRMDQVRVVSAVTATATAGFSATGASGRWFVVLSGGLLNFNIPAGALIQEKKRKLASVSGHGSYQFAVAVTSGWGANSVSFGNVIKEVAWELLDGRIIPFSRVVVSGGSTYARLDGHDQDATTEFPAGVFHVVLNDTNYHPDLEDPLDPDSLWNPAGQPPAFIPRLNLPSNGIDVTGGTVNITQQPEFTPSVDFVSATKMNYPTGPGGSSAAFDGSDNTGFSVGAFGSVTFTFPSVAAPFANNDTVRSVLRFVSQGTFTVSDGLSTTFATPTGSKDSYTINLGTPQNYNQSVRFTAGAGGGVVYELSWEHELETTLTVDRTTDVAGNVSLTASSDGDSGYEMFPVRRLLVKVIPNKTCASPWTTNEGTFPFTQRIPTLAAAFANLQLYYLERDSWGADAGDGTWPFSISSGVYANFLDYTSYSEVASALSGDSVRANFAITEPIAWSDLERQLAAQFRVHAYYGPNGHRLVRIPTAAEAESFPVEATYRLVGVPNPNAGPAGGPLIERTSPSEIINRVDVSYNRLFSEPSNSPVPDRFRGVMTGREQSSIDVFGERGDPDGNVLAWAITEQILVSGGGSYSAQTQASGLADFFAQRQAFARTRFRFETAWPSFGLVPGSVIRVAYASAPSVYRNVVCEVEDIQTSPINAERRIITARSIAQPVKGIEPAYIWTDLFVLSGDAWTTRFTSPYDRWDQYFGVRT